MFCLKPSGSVRSVLALVKIRERGTARRPAKRRLVQLYCALLYNANLKGFVSGKIYTGPAKAACVPGLNCYSCPGAIAACPLGALQNALASSGTRAGTYVLGILMLYGLILGRTICGWLCPFGMIQELLHKIPTPKIGKSSVTRILSYLKYAILAIFSVAIPLWYGLRYDTAVPGFCKYICPAGTFEGAVALLGNPRNSSYLPMLGILFTRKIVIMLVIALACIFCYRSFCRFLCPLGAIYSFFCRFAVIGVKVDERACTRCGACVRSCKTDIRHVGDRECIHCGECMDKCPANAISIKAGNITLKAPKPSADLSADPVFEESEKKRGQTGRTVWALLIVMLCGVLVYLNIIEPARNKASSANTAPGTGIEESAPTGSGVGQQLQDFTIRTTDGEEFHLEAERGHTVIINLWATWCAPCVKELPYFDRLQEEHPEVTILAIHSPEITEDVNAYLQNASWDNLRFAADENGEVWPLVNGGDVLPQTIVLDAEGEVTYNMAGSVTYEKLEHLLSEAEKG